ncbi:MAG: hypothetical protein IPO93_03290 [Actinobacteria bacterium]|nr:hypothetical protein [Actinomycetota bacterium]
MNRSQDADDLLPDLDLADVLRQRPLGLGSVRHVVRIAIAVTVSMVVALAISQSTLGIFAPITTLIVVQSTPWTTLGLSIQRILGTGIGVLVASLWVNLVGLTWWSFLLGVLVALLVARALPWSLGGQLQIPVAVVFVLALGAGSLSADLWRVFDVIIGGAIGLLAVFVYPPRPKPEVFEAALRAYRDGVVQTLASVADESGTHAEPLAENELHDYVARSRRLRDLADAARTELVRLVEGSHLNLRARGVQDGIEDMAARLRRLTGIGVQVRGIVGAANRLYDREGLPAILSGDDLRLLVAKEVTVMDVVLGGPGMPVRGTDAQLAEVLDLDLAAALRETADRVVKDKGGGVGSVLESVSLIERLDHVRAQLADYPK